MCSERRGSQADSKEQTLDWSPHHVGCEVPGRGHQMTPDRVLTEMKQIGLTEFGPQG